MTLLDSLPSDKDTLDTRSTHVAVLNNLPEGFLRNHLTQKFLETHEKVPQIQFGMLQEDTREVAYYKVVV